MMSSANGKRIITDRRREQNRQAQKLHRAKMKSRLLQLEQLQQANFPGVHLLVDGEDSTAGEDLEHHAVESPQGLLAASSSKDLTTSLLQSISTPPHHNNRSPIAQSFIIRPYTSDPRLNHLSVPHISLISAATENCLSLGLARSDALTAGFQSPFYDPNFASTSDIQRSSLWGSIPRDPHPTSLQFSVPHQAWIDSIPIPSFRDGTLAYLAAGRAGNEHFNLSELAADVDNGGLICWGGNGAGSSSPGVGNGTPWDARSWEARPWFLVKWRHVTGGLEGELGKMSMWWWRLKGEKFEHTG